MPLGRPLCMIIADGGIKTIGDISKALVGSQSKFVMAGGLFAGYDENPKFTNRRGEMCIFEVQVKKTRVSIVMLKENTLIVEPKGF